MHPPFKPAQHLTSGDVVALPVALSGTVALVTVTAIGLQLDDDGKTIVYLLGERRYSDGRTEDFDDCLEQDLPVLVIVPRAAVL